MKKLIGEYGVCKNWNRAFEDVLTLSKPIDDGHSPKVNKISKKKFELNPLIPTCTKMYIFALSLKISKGSIKNNFEKFFFLIFLVFHVSS